jgi:hypothetical protein
MSLGEQGIDLFRGEPITKLNGGLAGDHVEQLIEQVACLGRAAAEPSG